MSCANHPICVKLANEIDGNHCVAGRRGRQTRQAQQPNIPGQKLDFLHCDLLFCNCETNDDDGIPIWLDAITQRAF